MLVVAVQTICFFLLKSSISTCFQLTEEYSSFVFEGTRYSFEVLKKKPVSLAVILNIRLCLKRTNSVAWTILNFHFSHRIHGH
jgi:hypothetical protein